MSGGLASIYATVCPDLIADQLCCDRWLENTCHDKSSNCRHFALQKHDVSDKHAVKTAVLYTSMQTKHWEEHLKLRHQCSLQRHDNSIYDTRMMKLRH